MPLPPSRRDITGPPPRDVSDLASIVRHHGSYLRSLDPGYLGGRFATPSPVRGNHSPLVGDGGGDGGDSDTVLGEDGDRLVLTSLATQVWTLSHVPISETLVVRWHPDAEAGVEWKRGEHYTIDDDSNQVVIPASSLASAPAIVGDVFSAQYLHLDDEDISTQMDGLFLRGASLTIDNPSSLTGGGIALPVGTEIGDLIVVGNATMKFDGTPGSGTVTDSRMTQVTHGGWVGIATSLGPIQFANSGGDRHTGCVATFVPPAYYLNDAETSGGGGTGVSMTCPTVAASGAVLVVTEENSNSITGAVGSVPAGYTVAVNPNSGSTVCKAGIWYWVPDGSSSSPAGNIVYEAHDAAYAGVIGLQGET